MRHESLFAFLLMMCSSEKPLIVCPGGGGFLKLSSLTTAIDLVEAPFKTHTQLSLNNRKSKEELVPYSE